VRRRVGLVRVRTRRHSHSRKSFRPAVSRRLKVTLQSNRPPTRPSLWPALVEYIAAVWLIFLCTSVFILGVAWSRSGSRPEVLEDEVRRFGVSANGVMGAALISAGVLATITLFSVGRERRDLRPALRLGPSRASVLGVLAAVSGMVGLSVACGVASEWLGMRRTDGSLEVVAHALAGPTPAGLALGIATVAVAPGAAEEAFFRGMIQTRLVARWGPWRAIVVTAAGFGLLHFDLVQGSLAFIAGLFLGWVTERLGGVRPAMAAHAFNNALFVVLAAVGSADDRSLAATATAIAIGGLIWLASVAVLRSRFALRQDARLLGE
jgi:membrane protease YdiL (CAAX protease family)